MLRILLIAALFLASTAAEAVIFRAACVQDAAFASAVDSSVYGITTGSSDNAAAFNALPAGAVVKFLPGTYRINSSVNLKSNQKFVFDTGGKVYAPFASGGGLGGVFKQSDQTVPLSGVYLCDMYMHKDAGQTSQVGRFINLNCNDCQFDALTLDGPQTNGVTGGGGLGLKGSNFSIRNSFITNCTQTTGCFGIRIFGGSGIISNIYADAGDDAIALGPGEASDHINGVHVRGIRGRSYQARLVSVSILTGNESLASIANVSVVDVKGLAEKEALKNANDDSRLTIANTSWRDIDITLTAPAVSSAFQIFGTIGYVRNVSTSNVIIRNSINKTVRVQGLTSNIDVSGVTFP